MERVTRAIDALRMAWKTFVIRESCIALRTEPDEFMERVTRAMMLCLWPGKHS
jgi:hypothetical protein